MYTPRARGHNSVLGAPTINLPQILTIDKYLIASPFKETICFKVTINRFLSNGLTM